MPASSSVTKISSKCARLDSMIVVAGRLVVSQSRKARRGRDESPIAIPHVANGHDVSGRILRSNRRPQHQRLFLPELRNVTVDRELGPVLHRIHPELRLHHILIKVDPVRQAFAGVCVDDDRRRLGGQGVFDTVRRCKPLLRWPPGSASSQRFLARSHPSR